MTHSRHTLAFTLIELAVVLVIVALLSGGIMIARHMIKVAEMDSIYRQIQQFEAARLTFENKYNCLAGDCKDAATLGIGQNGNGNGYLDIYAAPIGPPQYWFAMSDLPQEIYQYWYQLSNANLIVGTYTGQPGPVGNFDYAVGRNIPATARKDVGIGILQFKPNFTLWLNRFGHEERVDTHFYSIGRDTETGDFGNWGAAFSIAEVMGLDRKYDDGMANNGRLRVHVGWPSNGTVGCTLPLITPPDLAHIDSLPDYSYGTDPNALCNMWYLFWP